MFPHETRAPDLGKQQVGTVAVTCTVAARRLQEARRLAGMVDVGYTVRLTFARGSELDALLLARLCRQPVAGGQQSASSSWRSGVGGRWQTDRSWQLVRGCLWYVVSRRRPVPFGR